MKKNLLLFVFPTALFLSCSKDEAPPPTNLQITILDEFGAKVSGATVSLYPTEKDLQNQTNPIDSMLTAGEDGTVTFNNLSVKQYYWFVQKDCKNNLFGSYTTPDIIPNGTTSVNTVLGSTGSLSLINNSTIPYKVYIDGKVYKDIEGKARTTIEYYPEGGHSVKVVAQKPSILNPKEKTYTTIVSCGKIATVTFPN